MVLSGKYGTQRQAINKVIWYAAASNQQSHMVRSGKQSTKSYGTQRQAINKPIWYSGASNQQGHMVRSGKKSTKPFGTCLASITLLLLAPRPTSRRPPKRPIAASALPPAGGVVRRVTFALLHAPRPCTLLSSAPQLTRSVPLQKRSLRV